MNKIKLTIFFLILFSANFANAIPECCSVTCSDGSSCTVSTNNGNGSWCSCSCGYAQRPNPDQLAYCQGGGIAIGWDGEIPLHDPNRHLMRLLPNVKVIVGTKQ